MSKVRAVVPLHPGDAKRCIAIHGVSPRTTAKPLIRWKDYGTAKWADERRRRIGASEIAAVLGLSTFASPFSLWWSKQNEWDYEQTMAQRLGHDLEPIIGGLFAERRPDLLVCRPAWSLWRHPTFDVASCSPDFLAVAGVTGRVWIEPVECKSDEGGPDWGKPGTDEIPEHHRMQVLWQCGVLGAPRGHVVRVAGKRYTDYVVEYDDAQAGWFAGAVDEARAFVASLELGVEPEIDGHKATTSTLGRLNDKLIVEPDDPDAYAWIDDERADEYARRRLQLSIAEAEFARVQNLIRAELGTAKWGRRKGDGRRFVERRVYKRSEYTVPAGMVDQLHPKAK